MSNYIMYLRKSRADRDYAEESVELTLSRHRERLEELCRSMGINRVTVVDPYNLAECEAAVKEELSAAEPSVIISRRPCALLKYVKRKPPLHVSPDKCKSCKSCMKIGCPAISMKNGKARVDATLCVGCGVCTQMCKFDAFCSDGKEEA